MTSENNSLIKTYLTQYNLKEVLSEPLIRELEIFRFKAGDYLIRTYDQLEYLYFFVEGKAKVFISMENGSSLLIRFYEPLELVGDVEFVCYDHHICNMQAISDVVCIGIKIAVLKKTIESNSKLLLYICRSLGRKLASSNMNSAINQMYPLENRLASYLTAISGHTGVKTDKLKEIHTENLTELASLLGSSYRQLTRVIKKFKDQGILKRVGRKLEILDKEKISQLSRDIYD